MAYHTADRQLEPQSGKEWTAENIRLNCQTAFQCAPVLLGIKPSNLLIIEPSNIAMAQQLLRNAGVGIRTLFYSPGRKIILFVYRQGMMESVLKSEENLEFLKEYGYEDRDFSRILGRLQKRYCRYMSERQEFPHELGVLLGYPLEDVKGFIQHKGENFLCSGYWKVYANAEEAQKTFQLYDTVRKGLTELTEQGLDVCEAVAYWEQYRMPTEAAVLQAAG